MAWSASPLRRRLSKKMTKKAKTSYLEVAAAVVEAENYRMILLRQQSIKGFWIEPTKGYGAKLSEAKALEAQLGMVDE